VAAASRRPRLGAPALWSLALHAAAAAALLLARPERAPVTAPMYKVDLVAAPPGPRTPGVITPPAPTPEPPKPTPPPPRAAEPPKSMPAPPPPAAPKPAPRKAPAPATPTPAPAKEAPRTPPPRAGGGPTGGRGTDVVTVRTQGIDFPYPGYLSNIVRQIALNFRPENANAPLAAEVTFLVHRDGSISDLRFLTRSGDYAFDLEAQGAVEAAGSSRSFGPLPDGFSDDVLPVVFSFDPRILR
jgi:protein TonB